MVPDLKASIAGARENNIFTFGEAERGACWTSIEWASGIVFQNLSSGGEVPILVV